MDLKKADRNRLMLWLGLALMFVIVRGGFMLSHSESLRDDPDAYRIIAETLSRTGVFGLPVGVDDARSTAFRPPLYPWLLSWLVDGSGHLSNLAVAILQLFLGGLTVVLTWDIARRLLSKWPSIIAAGLVLIDPILLWQSTLVMTETIATALVMLVWWWWVVRICRLGILPPETETSQSQTRFFDAVVLGVLLVLCILCRPTFLVWAVMLTACLPLIGTVRVPSRVGMVAITLAVVGLGVGAWTLRNVTAVGHPVWGTTHGGYTLLLANNDSFYDYLENRPAEPPWRRHAWDPDNFFNQYQLLPRSGDEWSDDQVTYAAAKATIAHRPQMFWYSCWIRMTQLWQPFPHATAGRSTASIVVVGLLQSVVYALILIAAFRHARQLHPRHWRRWIAWWPAVAIVITLSGVHAVYWSNPRMRSPAIPALAIVAAAAFVRRSDGLPTDKTLLDRT